MEMLAIQGGSVAAISCSIDGTDCTDREIKYVAKVKSWEPTKPRKELNRIRAILATPMTDELRDWARRRENILTLFLASDEKEL
jgi:hypothetical protein